MAWASALSHIRFAAPGGVPLVVGSALLVLLLMAAGIRDALAVESAARRRVLYALRCLSALSAWLFAVQPQWVAERIEQLPGRISVLLDASRSMLIRDGEHDRLSVASAALQRFYDEAREKPALFTFGQDVTPIARSSLVPSQIVPRDDTRIGRAVSALASAEEPELGAVLLVSDGADRSPRFEPNELKRLGVRVHTLVVGDASARHDLSIQSVRVDGAAFLRQSVEVEVVLHRTPNAGDPVTLSLRSGGELIREASVDFDDAGVGRVKLAVIPTRLGRAVYTLSVATDPDDAVPENNERAFQLEVTRERLRALLVCGHPSWDARFLRALLKNDPAVDLITFFILRTQNDNSMAPPEELSLIPFPTEELFEQHLKSFDLIIFQDFDFGPYQMARYLPRIHDYVLNGGSFAMLGGDRSFGAGGYAATPIAEILPVTLPEHAPYVDEGEFAPSVVVDAAHHPLVELAPRVSDNLDTWQKLAPLAGVNIVTGLRQGAHALLVHPSLTTPSGQPMPVLSVFTPGRGRALALTTDSAYRWGMATAGRTGDASVYERFWDRALRWLARDPLLDPAQVASDRPSYGPGASMRVQAWLRDELYRPRSPGPFRLRIQDDHGTTVHESSIETDPDGRASLSLPAPARPAAYTISVLREGETTPLAEEGFIVEAGGDELADPRARPDVMKAIAQATGGEYYDAPSQLPAAAKLPSTRTRVLGNQVYAPFESVWMFLCLLGLFGGEWWLRRRAGLR